MGVKVKRVKSNIDIKNMSKEVDSLEAQIGWDRSAVYESGIPVATVAATQEFGSPANNIPSRSFMRSTIKEKRNEWKYIFYRMTKEAIQKGEKLKPAFTKLVLKAEGDFSEKITRITKPPLKKSTIQARLNRKKNKSVIGKLDKPLVDTGYMLATISSKIK